MWGGVSIVGFAVYWVPQNEQRAAILCLRKSLRGRGLAEMQGAAL